MFASRESFTLWLEQNADAPYSEMIKKLDIAAVDKIKDTYEQLGDLKGQGDMLTISESLGKVTPILLNVGLSTPALEDRNAVKSFAIGGITALFRLMDRGVTGENRTLTGKNNPMMAGMFPGGMEKEFVHPLADQAVESSLHILES